MKNYQLINQWAATFNAEAAYNELSALKLKYPWLKCEKSLEMLKKLNEDLPKVMQIIKLQEKQNAINNRYIEVNKIADDAIIKAIIEQYGL
jgi:hypothetical protein